MGSGPERPHRRASPRSTDRRIVLDSWEEVAGVVEGVRAAGPGGVVIRFQGLGPLELSGLSEELTQKLLSIPRGTRASILRTSLPHRPYAVRTYRGAEGPSTREAREV